MSPSIPPPAGTTAESDQPPGPPDFPYLPEQRGRFGLPCLDRLGLTQALGGLAVGLIALFSSYDHITFPGRTVELQQQWGIVFIAASLAIVLVDAELATRSRLRAAHERACDQDSENEERNRADQERHRADRERHRADQERHRAAEARERQAENTEYQNAELALLRRSGLLSARVLLDPTDTNRARLQAFLALIRLAPTQEGEF